MNRTVVLGLDGMSVELMHALIERRLLPNAARFMDSAKVRPLRSTVPFVTVPAWTSIFCGVAPGRHGLLWWTRSGPWLPWHTTESHGFPNMDEANSAPVWRLLQRSDARTAIVDVPATFPAAETHGVFISGFLAPWPHRRAVSPPALYDRVSKWHPCGGASRSRLHAASFGPSAARVNTLTTAASERLPFFREILSDNNDLVVMVLVGPDRLAHLAWSAIVPSRRGGPIHEAVERYWSVVDEFFGELLVARDRGDSVVVCSDHGSTAPPELRFAVRNWLVSNGYMRQPNVASFVPFHVREATGRAYRVVRPVLRRGAEVTHAATTIRRLTNALRHRIWRTGAGGSATRSSSVFDVQMGDCEVGLFVDPALPEAVRSGLIDELIEELREVSYVGGPVFRDVARAETLLGPIDEAVFAPDVIAVSRPEIRVAAGPGTPSLFAPEPGRPRGIHKRDGIFVLSTDYDVLHNSLPAVEDVAPTLLALLGFEPPQFMTGRTLVHVPATAKLTDEAWQRPESIDLREDEERLVEKHLRELGYIE